MTEPIPVTVRGEGLSLGDVVKVARGSADVSIAEDPAVRSRVQASRDLVRSAVEEGEAIYGVTTGFGANASRAVSPDQADALQNNILWLLKTGAGPAIPTSCVRAAMLLRLNSLLRGVSGIRMELLERLATFLNRGVTPRIHQFGSIGASGDLVPLNYLAGCLVGADPSFQVEYRGHTRAAPDVLAELGLPRLRLEVKEGLALVNGTSVMTGIAAVCVDDASSLLALSMGAHALTIQALNGREESFHPFIQEHKPHSGQIKSAGHVRALLLGSRMTVEGMRGHFEHPGHALFQDRYSLRCIPQYMAPIYDGIESIAANLETEINSANDNPLLDVENRTAYNGGNFLGQFVGVGMDQLRYYLGLMAKHLDTQVAQLMSEEFSNGLPMALSGAPDREVNMGLKGLQLLCNSLMPIVSFLGNSIADRYPTHAEQFNQNVNSQGYASANLARQSIDTYRHYVASALLICTQAVDLRAKIMTGRYDPRSVMSPATAAFYEAIREVVDQPPREGTPLIPSDDDRPLDADLAAIARDIEIGGRIPEFVGPIRIL